MVDMDVCHSCFRLTHTLALFAHSFSEMTMIFKNINKEIPVGTEDGKPVTKQILFDVSGVIKPKEVVALMVSVT